MKRHKRHKKEEKTSEWFLLYLFPNSIWEHNWMRNCISENIISFCWKESK